jgi:hypothetical protein
MLEDSFDKWGYGRSTKRKAIVFFLNLSDYLGLPKSPYFVLSPILSSGAPRF